MPPKRDPKIYIHDIVTAIEKIQRYTSKMTFEAFEEDEKTIDAVLRNFEVIGEACRHVPDELKSKFSEIPWNEMKSMRNFLIHEYFGIGLDIIWKTIEEDLPRLQSQIQSILESV